MIQVMFLSADHRVYQGRWQAGADLQAVTKAAPLPVSSPVAMDPPRFALLQRDTVLPTSHPDWVPIWTLRETDLWSLYCEHFLGGYVPPAAFQSVFHFGAPGFMASQLAHLVAKGRKRLTAGWIAAHQAVGLETPQVGWISVVTDGFGIPICAIETVSVEKLRFDQVTEEMARAEGEGDLTLQDWRSGHFNYWNTHEAKDAGRPFTDSEEIFVERFEVLKVFGAK
jgi:uncharacterized protein YhfF